MPPALPILASPGSALLLLCHGPGAYREVLTHCGTLANPFHSRGRDLPAHSACLWKPSLTEMQVLGPHIACGSAALPENLFLTLLCVAQPHLLCAFIHSRTKRSPFLPLFLHAYIAVTTDSPLERGNAWK